MSEYYAIYHTCRTDNGRNPKLWRSLCEDCLQETADRHRRETGHAVETTIVSDYFGGADREAGFLGRGNIARRRKSPEVFP